MRRAGVAAPLSPSGRVGPAFGAPLLRPTLDQWCAPVTDAFHHGVRLLRTATTNNEKEKSEPSARNSGDQTEPPLLSVYPIPDSHHPTPFVWGHSILTLTPTLDVGRLPGLKATHPPAACVPCLQSE